MVCKKEVVQDLGTGVWGGWSLKHNEVENVVREKVVEGIRELPILVITDQLAVSSYSCVQTVVRVGSCRRPDLPQR